MFATTGFLLEIENISCETGIDLFTGLFGMTCFMFKFAQQSSLHTIALVARHRTRDLVTWKGGLRGKKRRVAFASEKKGAKMFFKCYF